MSAPPNNRRSPLVAGTQIPSASEAEFGDLISKASFVPFKPAFDAWEGVNRYVHQRSEGSKAWRTQTRGISNP